MKKTSILLVAGAVIGLGSAYLVSPLSFVGESEAQETNTALMGKEITVYKTPSCGCCQVYTQYLEREGANVTVVDLPDLAPIKSQYGVPQDLQSCHTSVVGDYVVEGHIPLEVIEELLAEQPAIAGIALPGMPSGSPGMPGPKIGEWTIYAIADDGSVSEFLHY